MGQICLLAPTRHNSDNLETPSREFQDTSLTIPDKGKSLSPTKFWGPRKSLGHEKFWVQKGFLEHLPSLALIIYIFKLGDWWVGG